MRDRRKKDWRVLRKMMYKELCEVYESLGKNPSRLKKTDILAEFLKKMKKEEREIIYLLQGRIFPEYDEREIGISSQTTIKVLARVSGASEEEVIRMWKGHGDLGIVAEKLFDKKKQSTLGTEKLSVEKVLSNLRKLVEFTGEGTVDKKISLIAELLSSCSPIEARYLTRTLLADLRIGLGEGTLRDAIVLACFEKNEESAKLVQEAYDKAIDFALVFEKAKEGEKALEKIELEPGKPIKVMLFLKADSIEEGFERVGKPCIVEYKYDGFRMLISKDKEIKVFTRRLENVTKQFPEVVEYVKKYVSGKNFILDAEAAGYEPETFKYKPFQDISQRIKRKYDIEKIRKELPVEINVFDIIYYNGKSMIKEKFGERRKLIEKIIKNEKGKIRVSEKIITSDIKEAEKFYKKALEAGEEGIMMKNLSAEYKPGARVGFGIKIKPSSNEFDLVIIGAEYGTGKRAGWLTSFDIACKQEDKFLEIGKVSTGLKEKEEEGLSYKEMTEKIKKLVKKIEGKHVSIKPEVVVTVKYQNIQKSPTYSSGFALRFPRFTRLREDRNIKDIATIKEVEKEYEKQNL